MALAEILFERAGFDTRIMYETRISGNAALFQLLGGRSALLERISRYDHPSLQTVAAMPERLLDRYLSIANYRNWRSYDDVYSVSYLPFIFERTFSTFLHMNPRICPLTYPFSREEIIDRCYGGTVEKEIVRTFADVVEEIDKRQEYTATDRRIIFSLNALRGAAGRHRWD